MDLQLTGKKALITGGSKGIGRATAELLADEGCDVTLVATRVHWRKPPLRSEHAGR
jgi:NAD(P)-dependent dehydrogenase (short-subunit alcohol dehydrogenase family)